MEEDLDHDGKRAREDGSTAKNEEITFADVVGERDDCGHNDRCPECNGERKRKKPVAARELVDKEKIKGCRRKIARHENDGVRMGKPCRQKDHDISQRKTADGVK